MSMIETLMTVALIGASAAIDSPPRAMASGDNRTTRIVRVQRPFRSEASVYYAGCHQVRALGKAPLYAGQPGYRTEMAGDHDGIACEPISNRRR